MKTTAQCLDLLRTIKNSLKDIITDNGEIASLAFSSYPLSISTIIDSRIDVSDTTATSADVLATKTFYTADGALTSGAIQTVTASLSEGKVIVPVGYIGHEQTFEVSVEEGVDVSGVTAQPFQVLNTVKYVNSAGELVQGEMQTVTMSVNGNTVSVYSPGYIESGSVQVPNGSYTIDGNKVKITVAGYFGEQTIEVDAQSTDLSFVTAGANQILSGYVGADSSGNPVNGTIVSRTENDVTTLGTVVVPEGFYQTAVSKNLASSTASVSGNVVTITTGWKNYEQVIVGTALPGGMNITPSATDDYVLHLNSFITNGNITLAQEPNYLAENIKDGVSMWGLVGNYKGGGSEAGVLVDDGTGTLKVQKLTFEGETASNDGDPVEADGFYLFNTGMDEPSYGGGSGGSMEIYKCASVDATSGTWSGYLYNEETKTFSETLTEGLEYNIVAPTVGKVYNADVTMLIDLYAPQGLVFYAPLHEEKTTDEVGHILNYDGSQTFVEEDGLQCVYLNQTYIYSTSTNFPSDNASRTISFIAKMKQITNENARYLHMGDNISSNYFHFVSSKNTSVICETSGSSWIGGMLIDDDMQTSFKHVAITYNSSSRKMIGYINGSYVSETVLDTDIYSQPLIGIGSVNESDTTRCFYGYLAEVKLWNRALSSEEIKNEADRCLAMVESDEDSGEDTEDTTRIILSGATMAPEANGEYTLSEGTVEMTTYTSDNTSLEVTEPIVTSDTAKFVREDGWCVYANFTGIPWTWEVDDASGMPIYLNQTMSNDQRGGLRGTSIHQSTLEADNLTSVLELANEDPDSGGSTVIGTKLQVTIIGAAPPFLAGTYALKDSTATGYDRIWEMEDNSQYTIKWEGTFWSFYDGDTQFTSIGAGANPWDAQSDELSVSVIE